MPASEHKILIHGSGVIRNALLPIGIYFINIYLCIILYTCFVFIVIYLKVNYPKKRKNVVTELQKIWGASH